jgi:hypothetical protein
MQSTHAKQVMAEVARQFTKVNNNQLWEKSIKSAINSGELQEKDLQDVATFLTSNRVHRELMEKYWNNVGMTEQHRVEASAHTVGLRLPKMFQDLDRDAPLEGNHFGEEWKSESGKHKK